MKAYFLIAYIINSPKNSNKSAIVSVDFDHSNSIIEDLAKLAFEKIKQKYPNNKLLWIDYTYIGHSIEFIDV